MTLNGPILIKTAKNIVTSMNNNAFIYSLTGSIEPSSIKPSSIEPSSIEPSIVRRNNKGKNATYFYNDDNDVNIENLTVNIDFLDCYFDDDG